MKDRQKQILNLLVNTAAFLRIEDIAQSLGVGKRTVSRDLNTIEKWVVSQGALLERKPHSGVRVVFLGMPQEELITRLTTKQQYISDLGSADRQNLISLYLLYENREVKISELAHSFLVSDTTVWKDLNALEEGMAGLPLALERRKGVGIKLVGEEFRIRMEFLRQLSRVFSSHTIIPYLHARPEDFTQSLEMKKLILFLRKINFRENKEDILPLLQDLSRILGYQITMSGEGILYFYLQLMYHRVRSGGLMTSFVGETSQEFFRCAQLLMDSVFARGLSGKVPHGEIKALALLIKAQDREYDTGSTVPGDPPKGEWSRIGSQILLEFSRIDNQVYDLNSHWLPPLLAVMEKLLFRQRWGIPEWHGQWGRIREEGWNRKEKSLFLRELFKKEWGLTMSEEDIFPLVLTFQNLVSQQRAPQKDRIRCLVSCFEGIGLSAYLQSLLSREFPELDVIESTAVYKINSSYLKKNKVDLLISTFPLSSGEIPSIQIRLPLNKDALKRQVYNLLSTLKPDSQEDPDLDSLKGDSHKGPSFHKILQFIGGFRFILKDNPEPIPLLIRDLGKDLDLSPKDQEFLTRDLWAREKLGALSFDEFDLRILHCRTEAVTCPLAGVVQNGEHRVLFLLAPQEGGEEDRLILSHVTHSVLDNRSFRQAVLYGEERSIQKELLQVYRDFI